MIRKTSKRSKSGSLYAARLLFECTHPSFRTQEKLFEDRIVLIRAADEDEAWRKAKRFGEAGQIAYRNPEGKKVRWKFRDLLDVAELFDDPLKEGSEVYYRLLNKTQLDALRRSLRSSVIGRTRR